MKLLEVIAFEMGYQARRAWTWVYFAALLAISFKITVEAYGAEARDEGFFLNAPFVVAAVTMLASAMGLLAAAALAGDAAARDVQTRMHPLVYTAPVGKGAYLRGRFLAALGLNALVLLSVQIALLLATAVPGLPPGLLGPFRPGAHLAAYLLIALPGAYVATALLFSLAALSRRAIAGYLGAVLLFFASMLAWQLLAVKLGRWELAKVVDPLGLTVFSEISRITTPAEKNALSLLGSASLMLNRAVWMAVATAVLALTHLRFRFDHAAGGSWWRRGLASRASIGPEGSTAGDLLAEMSRPISVPRVERAFGPATRARQVLVIALYSFREIALSWGGVALAGLATLLVVLGPRTMSHLGVPLIPTTRQMTGFVGNTGEILWLIVPLLTVFYAGEFVWRDRETGLSEISDAAPVPEWARFAGRFAGLALVFAAYQALMMAACILIQAQLGYHDFEVGLYARIFFGLQLADHLLFALLALAVHVLVDQKYVGHLAVLAAYGLTASAPALGIEHNLLVYGAAPAWSYSDMRGFGPSAAPWTWLKLYWAAWALLLAVAARLFWVRGREQGLAWRLRLARRRLTRPTLGVAGVAAALVVGLGGFIFYNTNVLNAHETASDRAERSAEYERRYGRYEGIPQPRLTGTTLRVEIHPERREVEIRGTYRLVNLSGAAIGSIHLAPEPEVETGAVELDRPAALALDDRELGHRTYALRTPLMPGDSLRLGFTVRFRPRGFTNGGADPSVAGNGTYFEGSDWLPAVGYQPDRELTGPGERRTHGLPPRPAYRSLDDMDARRNMAGAEQVALDVVVGTAEGQTAVAPGALRRTWTEDGRRYFHYATDVPIRNDFAIYSAAYAVRRARWNGIDIQVLHHPAHAANVDRMVRSARASLDHLGRRFGPYPHGQLRLVERPGSGNSLHASPVNISYLEGFSLFDPDGDPRGVDFPFAVVAHEVAHQWWGNRVLPANVEGGPLLSESLAWYTAFGVVEEAYGRDHLRRLLGMMREMYEVPRARAAAPLLRASDRFHAYRKGPFAMYALREYAGAAPVDAALRRLIEQYGTGEPPLPTSLDLYRELRAATPDSLRPLLADLFEANTFWELAAERVVASPAGGGAWRVTLDVRARKVVVDTAGVETEVPMSDLVEIGVYAAESDGGPGRPLYLRLHRVRSGRQRITVTVPGEPARAGIDPRILLIDLEPGDNVEEVMRAGAFSPRTRGGTPPR